MEQLLLKIASAVAQAAATAWLRERDRAERRGAPLVALLAKRYPMLRHRRQFRRKLEEIEEGIVERLGPLVEAEFGGLDDNERAAALIAVADCLEKADLSDTVLFSVDLQPDQLVRAVRRQVEHVRRASHLSAAAEQFHDLVLDQACRCMAYLVLELPEFQSRAAAEMLSRLSTVAAQVESILDRLPSISMHSARGADQDEEFRLAYLELVSQLYDRMELLGITTVYYEPRMTLTVAYLSLSASLDDQQSAATTTTSTPEPTIAAAVTPYTFSHQMLRVEDALGGRRRTLVQGDAGAGKSTLLQWLAVTAAHSRFTGKLASWNGLVPFLVRLRDFAGQNLPVGDQMLTHANAPSWGTFSEGWVHRIASSGRALFLIDGVDELMENERGKVRTWLRTLVVNYPEARIVVTSRPSAVTKKWLAHDEFDTLTLEPMNTEDVRVFVNRWHSALLDATNGHDELLPCKREDVPRHERTLLAHLDARPPLRALARNPLLCAMISALNLDRRANLPRDRVALYEAALEMLLERRDLDNDVPAAKEGRLTVTEKRALLRALAWWLNENGRAEMSHEEALHQLHLKIDMMPNVNERPDDVLIRLLARSGVIRQPVIGRIDFVHRTFQEFLAAKEAIDRDSVDMLINNAHSDLWRETVLMACAHASPRQRERLLDGLLNRAYDVRAESNRKQLIMLAVACLEMAVEVPRPVVERIERAAAELIPPVDVHDVVVLATMGRQLLDRMPGSVAHLTESSAQASVRVVALVNEVESLNLLASYAADTRQAVQSELLNCWHYFDMAEYAAKVLSAAPLFDGFLEVRDRTWLPHLEHLTHLTDLDVRIRHDWLPNLRHFAKATRLRSLLVKVDGDCDLAPLSAAHGLAYVHLEILGSFGSLDHLAKCAGLREVVLKAGAGGEFATLDFLRPLVKLSRLELDGLRPGIVLAPLRSLSGVKSLALRNSTGPLDLRPVAEMPRLIKLDLREHDGVLDLEPLNTRSLRLRIDQAQEFVGLDRSGPVQLQFF